MRTYRSLLMKLLHPKIEKGAKRNKYTINGRDPVPALYLKFLYQHTEVALHELQESYKLYTEKISLLNDLIRLMRHIMAAKEVFLMSKEEMVKGVKAENLRKCLHTHELTFDVLLDSFEKQIQMVTILSRDELNLAKVLISTKDNPFAFFVNLIEEGVESYYSSTDTVLEEGVDPEFDGYDGHSDQDDDAPSDSDDYNPISRIDMIMSVDIDRHCKASLELIRQGVDSFDNKTASISLYISKQLTHLKHLAKAIDFNWTATGLQFIQSKLKELGTCIINIYANYLDIRETESFLKAFNEIPGYQKLEWYGTPRGFAAIFKELIVYRALRMRGENSLEPIVKELLKFISVKKGKGSGDIKEESLLTDFKNTKVDKKTIPYYEVIDKS